jgi:hypothetical protein
MKISEKMGLANRKLLLQLILCFGFQTSMVLAQDGVPEEVKATLNMQMDQAQEKLEALGYEICAVKPSKKTEDWINQTTKSCITLKFDKKTNQITQVSSNPGFSECLKGLDKINKMWANYHDGQAPAGDARVNEERKKLESEGFKVSYWVNDVSPGRTAEYWVNESTKKVRAIVWDTPNGKWAMNFDSDYTRAKNPSPLKK